MVTIPFVAKYISITSILGCCGSIICLIWWGIDYTGFTDRAITGTAMMFSFLAMCSALGALCWATCCKCCHCCGGTIGNTIFLFGALLMQCCTMIILTSCGIVTCDLTPPTICSIVTICIYFIAMLMACALPSGEEDNSHHHDHHNDRSGTSSAPPPSKSAEDNA